MRKRNLLKPPSLACTYANEETYLRRGLVIPIFQLRENESLPNGVYAGTQLNRIPD